MASEARTAAILALILGATLGASPAAGQTPRTATSDELPCASEDEPRRRRPGHPPPSPRPCSNEGLRPAIWGQLPDFVPIPDRWRIVSGLGYEENLWDPYGGSNVLKGDRPAFGDDGFFFINLISDSTFEERSVPTPVAAATSPSPGALDLLGDPGQTVFVQNLLAEIVLYKGETVFKPPDYELRFIPVFNLTHVELGEAGVLKVDTTADLTRTEGFVAVQGLFVDKHLRNVSDRYDFDSLRIGVQPITADFRGFLFQDSPVGIRLFGTRDNNRWQYNLGAFRRITKDTNSGLNDLTENDLSEALRDDDVYLFNVYRQDFPVLGFTSQLALVHNVNREKDRFVDDNGFLTIPAAIGIQEPREYDVTYLGYNGDGHVGRWNLSLALYYAFGSETPATFRRGDSDIRAGFVAAEVSRDFDWLRVRGTFLYGSGDDDPFDDRSTGFDAILENPLIAGADTGFWIRQSLPLIGGGRIALSGQNGVLNSMRPNKFQGQSNFTNPGIVLAGAGADLDLAPKLRVSLNAHQLWFDDTAALEAARNQAPIDRNIGQDLSLSAIYRPLISQNVILRLTASALLPASGYEGLFGDDTPWSVFANLILAY